MYVSEHSGVEVDAGINLVHALSQTVDQQMEIIRNLVPTVENLSAKINQQTQLIDNLTTTVGEQTQLIDGLTPAIGDLFFTTSNIDPSSKFSGTSWEYWGKGRTLVGVDTSQTEFNTVEKVGGSKAMQSHTHTINHTHTGGSTNTTGEHTHEAVHGRFVGNMYPDNANWQPPAAIGTGHLEMNGGKITQPSGNHSHTITHAAYTGNSGSTGDGNAQNLQPYITCYIWKRIG